MDFIQHGLKNKTVQDIVVIREKINTDKHLSMKSASNFKETQTHRKLAYYAVQYVKIMLYITTDTVLFMTQSVFVTYMYKYMLFG